MRILIDLQGAQSASRFRGIGRSTLAHALAMARNRAGHEIFLLLNGMMTESIRPIRDAFAPLIPQANIRVWHALAPLDASQPENVTRRKVAALLRDEVIQQIQPDILHVGSLFDGFGDDAMPDIWPRQHAARVAVTFHDAIPLIYRDIYLTNPLYEAHYFEQAEQLKSADLILSVSASAGQETVTHFGIPAERVVNMSSSVDAQFAQQTYTKQQTQQLQAKFGIHKPYLMYSSATDERKNHRGLIDAFSQLSPELRTRHQLVLAGGLPPEHHQQFEAYMAEKQLTTQDVLITGRISDEEMIQLYNQCTLYVFPSWHEGFGLPALEAMACGAPTIGANTSSVPEVIGWERALFDPFQPSAIAQKITEALTDPDFLLSLQAHASHQTAQFSWDASAQRAIAAFEALLQSHPAHQHTQPQPLLPQVAQISLQDPSLNLLALSQAMAHNAKPAKPQLLVDVSELIQRDARTGIQRVVRSILHEWLSQPDMGYEVKAIYATAEKHGYCYANAFTQRFMGRPEIAQPDAPIDFAHGDLFLALDMQPQVQVFQAPYLQHLRDNGVKVCFVLYDLLPITMPQYFPDGAQANHTRWVEVAAQSDAVLCISRSVADEFCDWLRVHQPQATPQVDWFHMGADIDQSAPSAGLPPEAAETLAKLGTRPNFLLVGTMEPRKGQTDALDAAEALWASKDFNLIIVGKQGWKVDELVERIRNHPELNLRLFWLNGISDEYLTQVYAHADCLIAASFGEGFGLPLIEAAQRKIPLLIRDIPVFREVAGEHALYFDAQAEGALQDAMQRWLALNASHQAPQSANMPWLSWRQSAEQLQRKTSIQVD